MIKKIPTMMIRGIKKWFKKEEISYENVICKNCETNFNGKFCPECGQSVKDYDKPFSFIFYNFVGDFFAFDTRFFRTFVALLLKPGFLSREYFNGKRIKYAPPFRIFIFVSFIMFLLLQNYTNKGLTTVLDTSLEESAAKLDSMSLGITDSIYTDINQELEAAADTNLNFKLDMATFRDTRDLRQGLNKYATVLENKLKEEDDPKEKAKIREHIRLCRSPEQTMAKILEYMSWAFFLLLPLFAIILKLVYIRRKHNYMRHLIFSIHIHSFIFIVFTVVVSLYMIFKRNLEAVSTIFIFLVPVYFIIALKKFYGQSIGKVIAKFFVVSFLYNTIFWLIVGFVFLNALRIL